MKLQTLFEAKDTYYYYGTEYGRGGDRKLEGTVTASAILKYIELKKADDDDGVEDHIESFFDSNINVWSMLPIISNLNKTKKAVQAGKPFTIEGEEHVFGLGKTKEAAKVAYADIM